ncbi:unnamed protein product, partial [marine sediment metagenome]
IRQHTPVFSPISGSCIREHMTPELKTTSLVDLVLM